MIASILAAFAVAFPAGAPQAGSSGGLYGVVRKGPTKPVCEVGIPCTAPAVGLRIVFVRSGVAVHTVTTGAGGRYRATLRPGTYVVRTAVKPGIGRGLAPARVVVPRGRYARANFTLDTGIR